jgi:hypothetical protein
MLNLLYIYISILWRSTTLISFIFLHIFISFSFLSSVFDTFLKWKSQKIAGCKCFDKWEIHKEILVGVENYPLMSLYPSFLWGERAKKYREKLFKKTFTYSFSLETRDSQTVSRHGSQSQKILDEGFVIVF